MRDGAGADLRELYRQMLRVRHIEEALYDQAVAGALPGFIHSSIGQEAVAVGIAAALQPHDYITSTHRGIGHVVARSTALRPIVAEIFGKATGCCGGKGGSMHLIDLAHGILGCNGIVGGALPLATGAALSAHLRGDGRVVACFFGDGAANQGTFHESLNLAALWRLPILFVCENNRYGEPPQELATCVVDVARRAAAYDMPGVIVDGMDVVAVYRAAQDALARARAGAGPTLLECKTYRFHGHRAGGPEDTRDRFERHAWQGRDPLLTLGSYLHDEGILSPQDQAQLQTAVQAEVDDAIGFARSSPDPDPAEVTAGVYVRAGAGPAPADPPPGGATMTMREAIRLALRQEMRRDRRVIVLGEDVGAWNFELSMTWKLWTEFGLERVRDTPISESGFIGAAAGAAATGLRPVAELMFVDFAGVAMDQLANQAAKWHYRSGGQVAVPLTVRTQCGAGFSAGPQHAQSLEAWFLHLPGLKCVMPATPADAKGLLAAAIRDDDPVLYLEHALLYDTSGLVPEEEYVIALGTAAVRRQGRDVTVVALGQTVLLALQAAETLAGQGIDVEVVDLRSIVPLDTGTIVDSVRRTGRLVVAHEAVLQGGVGAEIAAEAWDAVRAPIVRVGAPFSPVPFAPVLERAYVPDASNIISAVRRVMGA